MVPKSGNRFSEKIMLQRKIKPPLDFSLRLAMKIPTLADFRRIVVKVGSSLLVDARAGRLRESFGELTADLADFHRDRRDLLVVSSERHCARPRCAQTRPGPLKLEDSQAAAWSARSRWRAPGPKRYPGTASPPARCW